jgi:hypothetical protein
MNALDHPNDIYLTCVWYKKKLLKDQLKVFWQEFCVNNTKASVIKGGTMWGEGSKNNVIYGLPRWETCSEQYNFKPNLVLFLFQTYSQCAHIPTPSSENAVCQEFFKWAATDEGKKEKIKLAAQMNSGNKIMIPKYV